VPHDSVAGAMKGRLHELGAATVAATGVTVDGLELPDSCLTVAAAASKAIMCVLLLRRAQRACMHHARCAAADCVQKRV
jgi:hypothetical protein